jgi:hypothetical protein
MAKRPPRPRDPMQLAKLVGDIAMGQTQDAPVAPVNEARRKGGLKGGKTRAKTLSSVQRRKIARKAAESRWGRRPSSA